MKLVILLAVIAGKWLLCLWSGLGLVFLLFWLKGKQFRGNSEKWDDFFLTLPPQKVEQYAIGIYLAAALLSSGISYCVLKWAGFQHSLLIAGALFVVGALITEYRWFTKKRDYVLKRYQEIPQTILERRNGENKMDGQIVLREYQTSDHPALIGIIRETWQYDKFASPKAAQKLARAYLDSCLTNQTFTQVALVDEVPVGIIMSKTAGRRDARSASDCGCSSPWRRCSCPKRGVWSPGSFPAWKRSTGSSSRTPRPSTRERLPSLRSIPDTGASAWGRSCLMPRGIT